MQRPSNLCEIATREIRHRITSFDTYRFFPHKVIILQNARRVKTSTTHIAKRTDAICIIRDIKFFYFIILSFSTELKNSSDANNKTHCLFPSTAYIDKTEYLLAFKAD